MQMIPEFPIVTAHNLVTTPPEISQDWIKSRMGTDQLMVCWEHGPCFPQILECFLPERHGS